MYRPRAGPGTGSDHVGRAHLGARPDSTSKIESLLHELSERMTVILAPHNTQQAARMADFAAFFLQCELVEIVFRQDPVYVPARETHAGLRRGSFRLKSLGKARLCTALTGYPGQAYR